MTIAELLAVFLVIAGAFFGFVAVVGIVRLPDLYTRAHATSKSDTLGIILTLAGVALVFGADLAVAKTVLLGIFMFVTNPTAAHAITRAAYDQDISPWTLDDAESRPGDGAGSAVDGAAAGPANDPASGPTDDAAGRPTEGEL